jgi:predicted alpha/beta superfamily hydrolase
MTEPEELDPERPHTLTGNIRTHENFHSAYLDNDRTVLVYLPPSYDPLAADRYPVLYLHDGQNVFDEATSFGDEWHVDETAQELITSGRIQPIIVVGVYNSGEHRLDEYTPTASAERRSAGHANDYGRMLVEELKPFIDSHYNTFPGVANTAMGGSSLGGLVTMHLGLRYPTVFGKLAVLSPSVWWDNRVILREVEAIPGKRAQRIWLDAGVREGERVIADSRSLRDALVAKGWTLGEDLFYFEAADGEHNERSWAARVGSVLEFLFPPK